MCNVYGTNMCGTEVASVSQAHLCTETQMCCCCVQDIVNDGLISSAQLEAVLYANMRFQVFLDGPGKPRKHCPK